MDRILQNLVSIFQSSCTHELVFWQKINNVLVLNVDLSKGQKEGFLYSFDRKTAKVR